MEVEKKPPGLLGIPFECPFDKKLAPYNRIIIAAVILVSAAVRIIYFAEITQSPAGYTHRAVQSDMAFFHAWAKEIAAGDFLTDQALHPLNLWQRELAREYFKIRPDVEQAFLEKGAENPARALWDEWYGGKRFHQEPAYPYLVAMTYALFGDDVRAVFVWQMLLGILTNLLVWLIATRFFGATAGLAAAGFAILCAPLLFYEAVLVRSTLIAFVTLAIVAMSDEAFRRDDPKFWLLTGVLFGFAVLVKMSMVLVNFGVVLIMAFGYRKQIPRLVRNVALVCVGGIFALSPAVVRNIEVGAGPAALSSVGAITFACTNTSDYSPDIPETFPCSKILVPRIMGETGGDFPKTVFETVRTHASVAGYLTLAWKKFVSVWTWDEKPNNVNFYYARLYSGMLAHLPAGFAWIGPLGAMGLLLGLFRLRRLALVYVSAAATVVPLVAFYAISRFRSPLTALLIPFAAFALVWIIRYVRTRPAFGAALAALILLPPLLFHAEPEPGYLDHYLGYHHYYKPLIDAAKGDDEKCRDLFRQALRFEPGISPENPPKTGTEFETAGVFYHIRRDYAEYLRTRGAEKEADIQNRRAAEIRAGSEKFRRIPESAPKVVDRQ